MMRLWVQSYARQTSIAPEVTLSAAVHAVIVVLWVVATMPAANVAPESIANRVYYVPPPDKLPGGGGPHEVVHYVSVGVNGLGEGAGPRVMGNARPVTPMRRPAWDSRTRCSRPRPRLLRRRGSWKILCSPSSTSTPPWSAQATARRRPIR